MRNDISFEREMVQKEIISMIDSITDTVHDVSENISIFELGVDSIDLVELKSQILEKYAVELKMSDFFNDFTTHDLAELIIKKRR